MGFSQQLKQAIEHLIWFFRQQCSRFTRCTPRNPQPLRGSTPWGWSSGFSEMLSSKSSSTPSSIGPVENQDLEPFSIAKLTTTQEETHFWVTYRTEIKGEMKEGEEERDYQEEISERIWEAWRLERRLCSSSSRDCSDPPHENVGIEQSSTKLGFIGHSDCNDKIEDKFMI